MHVKMSKVVAKIGKNSIYKIFQREMIKLFDEK